MVALDKVLASNVEIPKSLPPGLVAVFAGATTGIGEATLKAYVKYAVEPKVYLLARNPSSAERVISECKDINQKARYVILEVDLSSMKQTDRACNEIISKENSVNLLYWSAGEVVTGGHTTPEGLHHFFAAVYYGRVLAIQKLLPLLQNAGKSSPLARIVNVAAGCKEGAIDASDIAAFRVPLYRIRGHFASLITLALERFAQEAPNVSILHDFPGSVPTPLMEDVPGVLGVFMRLMFSIVSKVLGSWLLISPEESGERHVYLATSGRYPPQQGNASGLPPKHEDQVVKRTDEETGSGIYSVDWNGEGPNTNTTETLKKLRQNGTQDVAWRHTIESIEKAKVAV